MCPDDLEENVDEQKQIGYAKERHQADVQVLTCQMRRMLHAWNRDYPVEIDRTNDTICDAEEIVDIMKEKAVRSRLQGELQELQRVRKSIKTFIDTKMFPWTQALEEERLYPFSRRVKRRREA